MASSLSFPTRPDRLIQRPPPGRMGALCDHPFAHRGLHGEGVTENGTAAFSAAIVAGVGIECDVQAGQDGVPIVIHDERLERLTGHRAAVANMTVPELVLLRLTDGGRVPMLAELLEQVAGRVPLLIEVKAPRGDDPPFWRAIAAALAGYQGTAGVMSFDPRVSRWFAAHAPAVTRGLVASNDGRPGARATLRHLAALRLARPDFVAWDIRDLPDPVPAAARRRGLAVFTWTVRTPAERARARANADQPIFE